LETSLSRSVRIQNIHRIHCMGKARSSAAARSAATAFATGVSAVATGSLVCRALGKGVSGMAAPQKLLSTGVVILTHGLAGCQGEGAALLEREAMTA
jgi:hypothetical protein